MPPFEIITSEVIQWAKHFDGPLFHALLTDPPYHFVSIIKRFAKHPSRNDKTVGGAGPYVRHATGFMGQTWDGGDVAFRPETWAAFLPLLHPGAFGMAFASARGWHRLAVAIEDAGYIIHPSIFGWLHGQGFPKATRIDTQIGRAAGAERPVVGEIEFHGHNAGTGAGSFSHNAYEGIAGMKRVEPITAAATDLAKTWEHHRYGLQAMKPALEPIIVFQKPYDGRPVDDITRTGGGALNMDGARIEGPKGEGVWGTSNETTDPERKFSGSPDRAAYHSEQHAGGRWPANFALSHTPDCVRVGDDADGLETLERWACVPECSVRRLNDQAGMRRSGNGPVFRLQDGGYNKGWPKGQMASIYGDEGPASRFYFTGDWADEVALALANADVVSFEPKADVEERERGLIGALPCVAAGREGVAHNGHPLWTTSHILTLKDGRQIEVDCRRNGHPTIKPVALIRWLARLLLPPDAYAPRRILVPFAGAGSEIIGARQAGWDEIVGVELHEKYADLARKRLAGHLGML